MATLNFTRPLSYLIEDVSTTIPLISEEPSNTYSGTEILIRLSPEEVNSGVPDIRIFKSEPSSSNEPNRIESPLTVVNVLHSTLLSNFTASGLNFAPV